jgi:uncharacterized protein YdhG (YjbR/CyaY superfamily)
MKTEVDKYISAFPPEVQKIIEQVRATIRKAAPGAEETISYGIPTFVLNGNLVHYAAFKNHIGFYSTPSGGEAFKKELSVYKSGKGSVQFPIDEPMPLELITKIVKYRVKENLEKNPKKKASVQLPDLPAPAKRALENKGITSLKQLTKYTEKEISELHGMGPSSIPKLKLALKKEGLTFKK